MDNEKLLDEKKYNRTKKILILISALLFLSGIAIIVFFSLIQPKINESNFEKYEEKLTQKKQELESKGIEYDSSAEYTDGEVYDLYVITRALKPDHEACIVVGMKDNTLIKDYCSSWNLKEYGNFNWFFGLFLIMPAIFLFMVANGRSISAFTAQQSMPIAKEVGKEIAPTAGIVGKEIAKGVKEGLKEDGEDK